MRRINKLIHLPSQKIIDFDLAQIISECSAKEEDCLWKVRIRSSSKSFNFIENKVKKMVNEYLKSITS